MSAAPTIVIVGTGQAGGWAAKTLRDEGYAGRIVLLGDEAHPPHERPPLSKAVLTGHAAPESTHLFKAEAFASLALDVRSGATAAAIDRDAKHVRLTDGDAIAYDKLILCTGGRARVLPIPGADLPGIFTLRTIADSLRTGEAIAASKHVIVAGGGWIGLEVAAAARKRGAAVTVVEMASRLCERTVPMEISAFLERLHRGHGVEIVLNSAIEAFAPGASGALAIRLSDGRTLTADVCVVGVGLIANDELARAAGIACENGVLVDHGCRSSDPDIFAAGDVAVAPNRWAGRRIRLESWQNAQDQGIAAARSALGREIHYEPLPWFWSDQFDANVQIYGLPSPTHRAVIRGDPSAVPFLAFYLESDRIKAAVGVNAARDLRFARRLIEQGKAVADVQLQDPAVPMAKI